MIPTSWKLPQSILSRASSSEDPVELTGIQGFVGVSPPIKQYPEHDQSSSDSDESSARLKDDDIKSDDMNVTVIICDFKSIKLLLPFLLRLFKR